MRPSRGPVCASSCRCNSWVTATFRQRDGRALHVRKATVAEPTLRKIYDALGIEAAPGGVRKLIV